MHGRGGGLVVSVLAFFKITKIKKKWPGFANLKKKKKKKKNAQ